MASSGVIGRHRALRPPAGTPSRSPRRAWLRPLLALLAIAVLPLLGRSAVLLAGSLSPAAPAPTSATPSATAPARPPADAEPTTAVPTPAAAVPTVSAATSSPAPVPPPRP